MLNLLLRLVAALPLRSVYAIGGFLGHVVYWLSPTYRRRLNENLGLAGYTDASTRREAIAGAGRQGLETPWIWKRSRDDLIARTSVMDMRLVDEVMADGRPVMFLLPHLGCFEVTGQFYAAFRPEAKTRPITVLYRVPRKSILRPLVEAGRAADGLRLAPAELRGVRMLMKAMKDRHAVGILPDQVPSRGEGAVLRPLGLHDDVAGAPRAPVRCDRPVRLWRATAARSGIPDSPAAAAGAADGRPCTRCSRHESRTRIVDP
jgi:KDO2-lipid IV(A) lauroyltransferase